MREIELRYSYDGDDIGDLFPLCTEGVSFSVLRNGVGSTTATFSLRALAAWCKERNFDVKRLFTPLRSSVALLIDGHPCTGGFLGATPEVTLGDVPDSTVPLEFIGWLGLTAGAFLHPYETYGPEPFNTLAARYTQQIIDRTTQAGRTWPLLVGESDTLASVQGTIDALKTLKDFLLERTDNATGTGAFDVYVDPYGVIQIRQHYGYDITDSAVFTYPDSGGRYGVKQLKLPPWDSYISDYYLSGAGNGYEADDGTGGTVITAQARNQATIENTGYWEGASSESDIMEQATLDAKVTAYVKDTDKPFSFPTILIDANPFRLWAHEEGGNLWVGDTVRVQLAAWAADTLPLDLSQDMRIEQINATISRERSLSAELALMPNE